MGALDGIAKLFNSEGSVFHAFANHYDMVYFGRIHNEDGDQRMVKGVTVSTQHYDEHSCIGTVHGYDVILLKRTDTIQTPSSNHTEKYSWLIMQFDLHTAYDYPHVFIDGGHHNELFYQTLFVKFARLMKVDKAQFGDEGQKFTHNFTAYTPPDSLDDVPEIVGGAIGETMSHHFGHFDFEWFQDRLIVYSTGHVPTKHLLEHMLRAGLWLSEVLDTYGKQKISAHGIGADIPAVERV